MFNQTFDLSTTFQGGSGLSINFVSAFFMGLALILFTIWAITGLNKTLNAKDGASYEEKFVNIIFIGCLFIAWVAFISLFTRSLF